MSLRLLHSSNDHATGKGGNAYKALTVGLAHEYSINISCYYNLWQTFSKNDDKLEQMLPATTTLTLAQLKHNLKYRMYKRNIYQMASFSEKNEGRPQQRESFGELMKKQNLYKIKMVVNMIENHSESQHQL